MLKKLLTILHGRLVYTSLIIACILGSLLLFFWTDRKQTQRELSKKPTTSLQEQKKNKLDTKEKQPLLGLASLAQDCSKYESCANGQQRNQWCACKQQPRCAHVCSFDKEQIANKTQVSCWNHLDYFEQTVNGTSCWMTTGPRPVDYGFIETINE